jgi:hypothetical protein
MFLGYFKGGEDETKGFDCCFYVGSLGAGDDFNS